MCLYLRTKFQVWSIILMSFRQRAYFDQHPPPPPSPQKEALKRPPICLGLGGLFRASFCGDGGGGMCW